MTFTQAKQLKDGTKVRYEAYGERFDGRVVKTTSEHYIEWQDGVQSDIDGVVRESTSALQHVEVLE